MSSSSHYALHQHAKLTTLATFLLLIAGGLVTSTDSGLAVPDWPLSYGTWFPPMVGGIVYEHGHRMIAASVGLMILVLTIWLWRVEPRRWVRRLGYAALAAVILQGVLGGLTVLLLLPPPISIAHACLGQFVFCLMISLSLCTSPRWQSPHLLSGRRPDEGGAARESPPPRPDTDQSRGGLAAQQVGGQASLRPLSAVIAGLIFIQLLLGAVIRHTGFAVQPHLATAVILFLVTGWMTSRTWCFSAIEPRLWRRARRLLILLGVQGALGGFVLVHRSAMVMRTVHMAVGAIILAQAVVLVWEVYRAIAPSEFHHAVASSTS